MSSSMHYRATGQRPGGAGGAWIIAGIGGDPSRQIVAGTVDDLQLAVEMSKIDVTTFGSPSPVHVPGPPHMTLNVRASNLKQIQGATYAECLQTLAGMWHPDEAQRVVRDGEFVVRRRSGF